MLLSVTTNKELCLQAVTTAIKNVKKLCFTDMPTEEESRLSQLPHFNSCTALQLVSYAYSEALDLDALLTACQDQRRLEQACAGVAPALLTRMAASLRNLQQELVQEDMAAQAHQVDVEEPTNIKSITEITPTHVIPHAPGTKQDGLNDY